MDSRIARGMSRRILLIMCAVIALIALIVTACVVTYFSRTHATQDQEITELHDQIKRKREEKNSQVDDDVSDVFGFSPERMRTDTPRIRAFISRALTWDSGASYQTARRELLQTHDLETSQFFTGFMPEAKKVTNINNERVFAIDNDGLNSAVGSEMDITVTRVQATRYTYTVVVNRTLTSDYVEKNDSQTADVTVNRRAVITVTTDTERTIVDATGYSATNDTVTSN